MKQQHSVEEFFLTDEDVKALTPKQAHPAAQSKVAHPKRTDKFATVPLWWAARAAEAGRNMNFRVCVDLVYRAWRARGKSFTMPNSPGASPKTKIRNLRALERAGLITVAWRKRKAPVVTLVVSIF
jgi:hypothetical protein